MDQFKIMFDVVGLPYENDVKIAKLADNVILWSFPIRSKVLNEFILLIQKTKQTDC